jgi:hypothetical protein
MKVQKQNKNIQAYLNQLEHILQSVKMDNMTLTLSYDKQQGVINF